MHKFQNWGLGRYGASAMVLNISSTLGKASKGETHVLLELWSGHDHTLGSILAYFGLP